MKTITARFIFSITALFFLLATPPAAAETPHKGLTRVNIKELLIIGDSPAILLLDNEEKKFMLMFVDYFMANAIHMGLSGRNIERPLTHDLLLDMLHRTDSKIKEVTITELKDNTYYALILVEMKKILQQIDARPSDALAIAVRENIPIFAHETLLKPVEDLPTQDNEPERHPMPPRNPAEPDLEKGQIST